MATGWTADPGTGKAVPASRLFMERLDQALSGPLEVFRGRMAESVPPPHEARTAPSLVLSDTFPTVVAHFEAQHGKTDYRAIVSIWSKWHFAIVMPPVLTANLLLGLEASSAFAISEFAVSAEGKTISMSAPQTIRKVPDDDIERFLALLDDHLAPFVAELSRQTGVTQRIFWSNAGNLFEAFVRRLEDVGFADRVGPADRFLRSRALPNGRRNPLHAPVRYEQEGERLARRRRVCCLRYFVPDGVYCTTCPITRPGSVMRHGC